MGPLSRASFLLLLLALLAGAAGCASMEARSDQPWGTQETWEGSLSIPGFSGY